MPLGRKNIGVYGRTIEEEFSSPNSAQERGGRRQHSGPPEKSNRPYLHKTPRRQHNGAGTFPEVGDMDQQIIRQNRPNRKREKISGRTFESVDSRSQFDKSTQPCQTGSSPPSNLTATVGMLVFGLIGLLAAFLLMQHYKKPVSNDINHLKLRDFQNKFNLLGEDFSKEVQDDSIRRLYGALERHVQNTLSSKKQDKGSKYPTCILLASDAHSKSTLDCLADRIAQLVPPKPQGRSTDKNIYVVDLSDKEVNHKIPDKEDLRSRVHHGINQGVNQGANVIVFKHIEVLVPPDLPLLELFYNYCDGENPTFPNTLWVLTLVTENLQALEEAEITRDPEVAKALRLNVEKYLENIIEGRPGNAHEQPGYDEKHSRNALLTRIANNIVPVLKTSRSSDFRCSDIRSQY